MYIVLFVYLLTLIHRQQLNRNQHRYDIKHELDLAEYTNVRIAVLCWASYITPTGFCVTSYLLLLAMSRLTCIPNMSFLARLVSDN